MGTHHVGRVIRPLVDGEDSRGLNHASLDFADVPDLLETKSLIEVALADLRRRVASAGQQREEASEEANGRGASHLVTLDELGEGLTSEDTG